MQERQSYEPRKYRRIRPSYPQELFVWLASCAMNRSAAWDCGTGSGQAAVSLTKYFDRVVGTDLSQDQLSHAPRHPRIFYVRTASEHCSLRSGSMDLLTVACALHWFDIPRFFAEARRVLKPYGILAAWVYSWPETGIPEIDSILAAYKDEILGSYWPEESRYYFNCYRDIDFPFERLENPPFHLTCPWGPKETLEFLSTWSGPQRYYEATGQASAERISEPLEDAWRKAEFKGPIYLPLYLYVGRID